MQLKQSTAVTVKIGPIFDEDGLVVTTGPVIGDITLTKAGTSAVMASAATLTHISNGVWALACTTGNTDTLGEWSVHMNNATWTMKVVERIVVAPDVYDALVSDSGAGVLATLSDGVHCGPNSRMELGGGDASNPSLYVHNDAWHACRIVTSAGECNALDLVASSGNALSAVADTGIGVYTEGGFASEYHNNDVQYASRFIVDGQVQFGDDWEVVGTATLTGAGNDIRGVKLHSAETGAGLTVTDRLTAARAGYLDKLNVTGNVASQADIDAINQSAAKRVLLAGLQQFERPESGSTTFTIRARTYTSDGDAVNADSTPTLTATGSVSGSLAANLSAASNVATGVYEWTYTVPAAHVLQQIRFSLSAVLSTVTFTLDHFAQVCDFVAATFTTTDRTMITAVYDKLPGTTYIAGQVGEFTSQDTVLTEVQGLSTQITSVYDVVTEIPDQTSFLGLLYQQDLTPYAGDFNTLGSAAKPVYEARISYVKDGADDLFVVRWYVNRALITSGITLPTITCRLAGAGTVVFTAETMSPTGSAFVYIETGGVAPGDALLIDVTATIDGDVRSDADTVVRDAAAP